MNRRICLLRVLVLACLALGLKPQANAQTTAFTYQGRLDAAGVPAQGPHDLVFTLFDAPTGGSAVGTAYVTNGLVLSNGLFTALLDFGAAPFSGSNRWLQIAVNPTGSAVPPVTLQPRQPLTAVPYANFAANADNAGKAGSVAATGIAGFIQPDNIGPASITAAMLATGAVSGLGAPDGSPTDALTVSHNGLIGIGTGTNSPAAGLQIAIGADLTTLTRLSQVRDGSGSYTNLAGAWLSAVSGSLLAISGSSDSAVTLVDIANPSFPTLRSQIQHGTGGFTRPCRQTL